MNQDNFFAGFIITYNRPQILADTITKVFGQSHPPEKLWIIDNSENQDTKDLIESMQDSRLLYHAVGFNAGPAYAANLGLKICTQAGYEWIYWGDDNDPPFQIDCFERLLKLIDEGSRIEKTRQVGILGAVGHYFDRNKGVIKRTQDTELLESSFLKVDVVAGGMTMLVNSEVIKKGVLPDPKLFFGFEELDFCLRVKDKGFEIVIDTLLFIQAREASGRIGYIQPSYIQKKSLRREYYSLRNLLIIADKLNSPKMKFNLFFRWFAKMLYGFRYGLKYGRENMGLILLAFYHYFLGKSGKTIELN